MFWCCRKSAGKSVITPDKKRNSNTEIKIHEYESRASSTVLPETRTNSTLNQNFSLLELPEPTWNDEDWGDVIYEQLPESGSSVNSSRGSVGDIIEVQDRLSDEINRVRDKLKGLKLETLIEEKSCEHDDYLQTISKVESEIVKSPNPNQNNNSNVSSAEDYEYSDEYSVESESEESESASESEASHDQNNNQNYNSHYTDSFYENHRISDFRQKWQHSTGLIRNVNRFTSIYKKIDSVLKEDVDERLDTEIVEIKNEDPNSNPHSEEEEIEYFEENVSNHSLSDEESELENNENLDDKTHDDIASVEFYDGEDAAEEEDIDEVRKANDVDDKSGDEDGEEFQEWSYHKTNDERSVFFFKKKRKYF